MKKKFLLLTIMLFVLALTLSLASCEDIVVPGVTNNPSGTQGGTNNGGGSDSEGNNNNGGNNTGTLIKNYTVTYVFGDNTVLSQTVTSGSKLSSAQLAEKDALTHEGKSFTGFFSDAAKSTEFDFNSRITKNTTIYCQLLYKVTYHYGEHVLLEQGIDSAKGYFTNSLYQEAMDITYASAKMTGYFADEEKTEEFDFETTITDDIDIYCQILCVVDYRYGAKNSLVLKQRVDSIEGFTEEHIKERDETLYNGYNMDYYFSDSLKQNAFDFESKPLGNLTIYCDRDHTKAGKNVNWEVVQSTDGLTLHFTGSGPMYEYLYADTDVPWNMYYSSVDNIYIEEGITSVADSAFYKFTKLSSVSFPNTIEHIGANSFYNSSVSEIDFPDSLKSIGENAFRDCKNLVNLNFNVGLENIHDGAFWGCANVVTVILTNSLLELGTSAFQGCDSLTTAYYTGTEAEYNEITQYISNDWVNLLAFRYYYSDAEPTEAGPFWKYDENGDIYQWYYSIWYIESTAYQVAFLVDYVDAEDGVTQENVDVMSNIVHNGYKFIGWNKFKGLGVNTNEAYNLEIGTVFSEDLKIVGDRGKLCGDNLEWNLASGTLVISKVDADNEDGAMWDFKNYNDAPWYSRRTQIKKVTISDGVTHLGSYAFVDFLNKVDPYSQLSYVDIPVSVTSIDATSFNGCADLLYVYYSGTAEELANLQGKEEFLAAMNKTTNTKIYTAVSEEDFANLGEGAYWCYINGTNGEIRRVAWVYEDNSLLVGGGNRLIGEIDIAGHDMINYASNEATPWYSYRDDVTSVAINANIVYIGEYTFDGMVNVESIAVTDRIAQISDNVFTGTKYYTEMYDSLGVVYVYNDQVDPTFRYGHLIKVDPTKAIGLFQMEEKTISIAANAFEGCSGLTSLIFTKNIGVKSVHPDAMTGLTALEAIYFYSAIASNEVYNTWYNGYQNTLIGEGELLHDVPVYFYSAINVENSEYGHWHWNEDKTAPVIYGQEQ